MEQLNSYVFFTTLTYDNKHLPTLNVNGYSIRYADFKHFTNMVKRIRNDDLFTRPFRYYAVSELGSKTARPHFHCLWFLPKYDSDSQATPYNLEKLLYDVIKSQWKVNISQCKRKPLYEPLFEFHCKLYHGILYKNYDTHYVRPKLGTSNSQNVVFYCMKYLLKGSSHDRKLQQALRLNLEPAQYNEIWNKVKSQARFSKHFGYGYNVEHPEKPTKAVLDYIRKGIKATPSGTPYPIFSSPVDGKCFPLSPYYQARSQFYSFKDAYKILMESKASLYNDLSDDFYQKAQVDFQNFQKHLLSTENNGNPILFD